MLFQRCMHSHEEVIEVDELTRAANLGVSFRNVFSSRSFMRIKSMEQETVDNLSHVGTAVFHTLRRRYFWHARKLWNVTSGKVVELDHMPRLQYLSSSEIELNQGDDEDIGIPIQTLIDFPEGHSDWLPEKIGDIISRTRCWCDLVTLAPPDGLFLEKIKEAIEKVAVNEKDGTLKCAEAGVACANRIPIVIRIIFANIIGAPVNCDAMVKELTKGLPKESNIQLWIGAWRRRTSWNHAKIIAVDGLYLHTGGNNFWEAHYLKSNPIHDLAVEMEGKVAIDGHLFADEQWAYIEKKQDTYIGKLSGVVPILPTVNRIMSSKFPKVAPEFPPSFANNMSCMPTGGNLIDRGHLPVITIGRNPALSTGMSGAFVRKARPSDAAFVAMINSATTSVRMILQDLGPMTIPGTKKTPLPGGKWPTIYLNALANVIWKKNVDVEIILSNPGSTPGGLNKIAACYGYGWSVNDVASEIIKRIKKKFFFAKDVNLRPKDVALRRQVTEKLRICYMGHNNSRTYSDEGKIGLHSKFFIVDDVSCYIGSQNLYVSDLAEWGVIIDDAAQTKTIMNEYWTPMWEGSYSRDHCDIDKVMERLHINRNGEFIGPTQFKKREKVLSYRMARHISA